MLLLSSFLVSLLIAVIAIPVCIKIAPRLGLVDEPNERKVHSQVIPRIGGLGMVIASLLTLMLVATIDATALAYFSACSILLVFGVWDDRSELGYRLKFLGQLIAILVFLGISGLYIKWMPLLGSQPVAHWFGFTISVVGLVGITNAVNLVDGLDGLAGGTSLISLAAIAVLAYLAGDTSLTLLCLAICGSIFGFLRYNTHPARVFMGDTGSQFLGFSVGAACLILTQQSNTALSPALPLLLLGLPILDTLTVMVIRLSKGRSPFKPDKNHFHHRLLKIGFMHYEAVSVIYLVQAALILYAYIFRYESDSTLMLSFLVFCALVNGSFYLVESKALRIPRTKFLVDAQMDQMGAVLSKFREHLPVLMSFSLLPVLAFTFFEGVRVEGIEWLYLGLAILGLLSFSIRSNQDLSSILERMFWYSLCGLGVYVSNELTLYREDWVFVYFAALTLLIVSAFRVQIHGHYALTPFDLIVLVSALVMFYLGQQHGDLYNASLQVTQVVLFLYAIEFIVSGASKYALISRLGLSLLLLVYALM